MSTCAATPQRSRVQLLPYVCAPSETCFSVTSFVWPAPNSEPPSRAWSRRPGATRFTSTRKGTIASRLESAAVKALRMLSEPRPGPGRPRIPLSDLQRAADIYNDEANVTGGKPTKAVSGDSQPLAEYSLQVGPQVPRGRVDRLRVGRWMVWSCKRRPSRCGVCAAHASLRPPPARGAPRFPQESSTGTPCIAERTVKLKIGDRYAPNAVMARKLGTTTAPLR